MNFDTYLSAVNDGLGEYMPKPDGYNDTVINAMEYSLFGGGKRLRPVIVLCACDIFAGGYEKALPFAAAIEMIHTYSLIHDDLPAMDDDDYRRGRLSCHKRFGECAAILAGDALLNTAFEVMLTVSYECTMSKLKDRYLQAFKTIARASGIHGMISGQSADIELEGKSLDEQTLTNINHRKTGAIISASFESGAIIGGASDSESTVFAEAGRKTGLAFQIKDDMLDYEGKFENTGKLAGSDKKNNKMTYVTALGRDQCSEAVEKLSGEALSLIRSVKKSTAFLEELICGLINRNR